MSTTAEAALSALDAQLRAHLPGWTSYARNRNLPTDVTEAGWVILRNGEPGTPDLTFSPLRYEFAHRAAVDILVESHDAAWRDAMLDALKSAVRDAVAADRTLGGAAQDTRLAPGADIPLEVPEGAAGVLATRLVIVIDYVTDADPLN